MKAMKINTEKRSITIFYTVCENCGKRIEATNKSQLEWNAQKHIASHENETRSKKPQKRM